MLPTRHRSRSPRLLAFVPPSGDPVVLAPGEVVTAQTNAPANPTEGRELQAPTSSTPTEGRALQAPATPPAIAPRGFFERHKSHLILSGAAVAVGLGVMALSCAASAPRENPSCGPSCGCSPCRARYNPSRTRRGKRAARRAR